MSASELWIAAQRMMPDWGRGRLNAAVIVISQGAMVLGGVIWGSASAIAGVSYALLGAAVFFLASLLLARQLPVGAIDLSSLDQTFDAHNEGRRLEKPTSESMTVFHTQ